MLLTGHAGEIFAIRASKDGTCLASAGFDQQIFLWNIYGDCENFSTLKGHKGSVMEGNIYYICYFIIVVFSVHFSTDCSYLFSASTDKTVRIWDMETGNCVRKFTSHTGFVNSVHPARRGLMLCVRLDIFLSNISFFQWL